MEPRLEISKAYTKLLILSILNVLDALFTIILIEKYSSSGESNPFVRALIENIGIELCMISKIVMVTVVFLFVAYRIKTKNIVGKSFLIGTNIMIFCYTILVLMLFVQVVFM